MEHVQRRVELEREMIRERKRWWKNTVERALVSPLELKNARRTHVQVSNYNLYEYIMHI